MVYNLPLIRHRPSFIFIKTRKVMEAGNVFSVITVSFREEKFVVTSVTIKTIQEDSMSLVY